MTQLPVSCQLINHWSNYQTEYQLIDYQVGCWLPIKEITD